MDGDCFIDVRPTCAYRWGGRLRDAPPWLVGRWRYEIALVFM